MNNSASANSTIEWLQKEQNRINRSKQSAKYIVFLLALMSIAILAVAVLNIRVWSIYPLWVVFTAFVIVIPILCLKSDWEIRTKQQTIRILYFQSNYLSFMLGLLSITIIYVLSTFANERTWGLSLMITSVFLLSAGGILLALRDVKKDLKSLLSEYIKDL